MLTSCATLSDTQSVRNGGEAGNFLEILETQKRFFAKRKAVAAKGFRGEEVASEGGIFSPLLYQLSYLTNMLAAAAGRC